MVFTMLRASGRSVSRTPMAVAMFVASATVATAAHADDGAAPPSPQAATAGEAESPRTPHCVGWGIAGALGGAALGFAAGYGMAVAAGGKEAQPTTSAVAMAGEGVGAIAGPIAACRLSKDTRVVPAASFITAGAIVGGAATTIPTYLLLASARPFGNEGDNPALSMMTLLAAVTVGGIGGGYLGWLVSEAREPASRWKRGEPKTDRHGVAVVPLVAKDTGGVVLGGAF